MSRFISFRTLIAATATVGLFISGFFGGGVAQAAMPATAHVTVHYQRLDADYTNWQVYTWKNYNASGMADVDNGWTTKTSVDGWGAVYNVTATSFAGFDSLGFIMAQGAGASWNGKTKDTIGTDRFITSFDGSGNAEIWVVSGDATVYKTQPQPPAPSVASAALTSFNKIHIIVSPALAVTGSGNEGFTVNDGSSDVAITSVAATNAVAATASGFDINLAANVDLSKTYTVNHAGLTSRTVSTAGLYDSQAFADAFTYTGDDLGNTYSPSQTVFRVWAPTATAVSIMQHSSASEAQSAGTEIPMVADVKGTWVATVPGDHNGMIYDYKVHVDGGINYASDPYARASTIDSGHSVVVDLSQTNPAGGWIASPAFGSGNTDASIYELQVRDLSSNSNSGIPVAHQKKFLALTDTNTSYSWSTKKTAIVNGKYKTVVTKYSTPTGVAAIKALGVTHVELLPVYDFNNMGEGSADENHPVYNWGYDPVNYNVPDGGFSSNASVPTARIIELKQGIQALHQQGLRTIMDVVYNHVSDASTFSEEQIVPGYFFRHNADGSLTSASGCGNDVDSERSMVSKFIVDSVVYWAKEYHFDGFRFDLMGLLDTVTLNKIRTELNKIDPTIVMIGEGWNMGTATNPANQNAASNMPNIGFFNDQIRDAVKGSVFTASDQGFVQGNTGNVDSLIASIYGQTSHRGTTSANWLATTAGQAVNYVEAHDNLTLWDKLNASMTGANKSARMLAADRQAAAILYTSQGLPFIQAGQEFLRTKGGDDNSYASSDSVNGLNWSQRALNASTVNYYAGLIALRKAHPAFRLSTDAAITSNVSASTTTANVVQVVLNGTGAGDSWKQIVVFHNSNSRAVTVSLPAKATWSVVVNGTAAGVKTLATLKSANKVVVPAMTSLVLHN